MTYRLSLTLLALAAVTLCASCAKTAPPGIDPVVYNRALHDCRESALANDYGHRSAFATVGTPGFFLHDKSWEVIDPCMEAKGFPPLPY
jgi:hypothetical protein